MSELPKPIKIDKSLAIRDPLLTLYVAGETHMQRIEVPGQAGEVALLAVFFEAGSRNRPHTHEHEQTLLVQTGRSIVATETEKYVLAAGEVIIIPANVRHWHGATHDAPSCQISIMVPGQSNFEAEERNWAVNYTED